MSPIPRLDFPLEETRVKSRLPAVAALFVIACTSIGGVAAEPADSKKTPTLAFREVAYFHRWSQSEQHEFTPAKQEDLNRWSDMITVNGYEDVVDGDGLAARANSVLENYKAHGAHVLKTNSLPRTADHEAEHLIASVFGQPTFIEVAFARFKMVEGKGCSLVYSHRIYGAKIGDEMNVWLRTNGPAIEKALMELRAWPSPGLLTKESLRTTT